MSGLRLSKKEKKYKDFLVPKKKPIPGRMAQTRRAGGRAATERFSAQLPRAHWNGPEA